MKQSHHRDNRTPAPPLPTAQRKMPAQKRDLRAIRLRRHYDFWYRSWENREAYLAGPCTLTHCTIGSNGATDQFIPRPTRHAICHREVGSIVNLTVRPNPDSVPNVSSTADGS